MKKSFLFILISTFVLLLFSGCGNKEMEPKAIDEKNDKCIECNMAVADDQFATQLSTDRGKVYAFDDIGCMFEFKLENKDEEIAAEFVRDYDTLEWIKLEEAYYVYHKEIYTPMAFNAVSFSSEEAAKEFAADYDGAELMKGNEITKHDWNFIGDMTDDSHDHDHIHE